MGLDAVEFVLAVEDAFGLAIPDEDARRLTTPGSLVDYLVSRLQPGSTSPCLEQRAFYRVRRVAMLVLDQPRSAFSPETPWRDLLHPELHRPQWDQLGRAVGLTPWPPLKRLPSFGAPTQTVGETAMALATMAPAALIEPDEGWSRGTVELTVQRIMAEELGITRFRWTDSFVQDLGVD